MALEWHYVLCIQFEVFRAFFRNIILLHHIVLDDGVNIYFYMALYIVEVLRLCIDGFVMQHHYIQY